MCTVQLNARETSISHEPRRIHKLPGHPIDIRLRHLPRLIPRDRGYDPPKQTTARTKGNGTWGNSRGKEAALTCAAS